MLASGILTPCTSRSSVVVGSLAIAQAAGPPQKIDDDLVDDLHDGVPAYVVIANVGDGVIGQDTKRRFDQPDILRGVIYEQVDVLGGSCATVSDDGDPPMRMYRAPA